MKWWKLLPHRWTKRGPAANDSQRSKLYRAESFWRVGVDAACQIEPNPQAFIDKVTSYKWYRRRFPRKTKIVVRVNPRLERYAYGGTRAGQPIITLPGINGRWARQRWVLLHELAHCISSPMYTPPHGRRFARTYVCLVRYTLGKAAADKLKAAFRKHRVKFSPYPNISEAERERRRQHGKRLAAKLHSS